MVYKKAFVDNDILIDLLLQREPFSIFSKSLLNDAVRQMIELNTSSLILANIHYVISKNLNKAEAINSVKYIMSLIKILPFEESHISAAIAANATDFEDSVQYYIAAGNNCDLIISRNIKHYKKYDLPVLTAEDFLRKIL
ncbi:MAG TPA: PIN domain-containing protein [Mucilaginibacter sp.]|nr:PIN domain-containing protein [Mucilaginibacter sp.]